MKHRSRAEASELERSVPFLGADVAEMSAVAAWIGTFSNADASHWQHAQTHSRSSTDALHAPEPPHGAGAGLTYWLHVGDVHIHCRAIELPLGRVSTLLEENLQVALQIRSAGQKQRTLSSFR